MATRTTSFSFFATAQAPNLRWKDQPESRKVTDLVFRLAEPFPDAVGIYVEHSMGRPNEFIPWEKVMKIDDDAIFITPAEDGKPYPSFIDQKVGFCWATIHRSPQFWIWMGAKQKS